MENCLFVILIICLCVVNDNIHSHACHYVCVTNSLLNNVSILRLSVILDIPRPENLIA